MPSSPSTVKTPARSASISSATKAIMSAGVSELDGDADGAAAAALLQRRLVGADEVVGLLLELDAGVADQPEQAALGGDEAREEAAQAEHDQVLQQHEADAPPLARAAGG